MHRLAVAAAVILVLGVTAACGSGDDKVSFKDEPLGLLEPLATCQNRISNGVSPSAFRSGDDNKSILIDTNNEEGDMQFFDCLLDELDVSDALRNNIGVTTSMMGRQSGDSGDYHYEWSYHPDSGINMTITTKE